MHPNPIYRQTSGDDALAFARDRGFGMLTLSDGGRVLAAHVPFVLREGRIEAHLVRSNPVARALAEGPREALLAVSGPDAYVSPDWYGVEDQVPTWNYLAAHLRGTLRLLAPAALRAHLDRLAARFEGALLPKTPWTADKMRPETLDKLMRAIVPVEMAVEHVDSTVKLSQNKSEDARRGVAAALAEGGTPGQEAVGLGRLMRGSG